MLSKWRNSRYLTVIALNSFMKVSKKPNNTGVLNLTFQLKSKSRAHMLFFSALLQIILALPLRILSAITNSVYLILDALLNRSKI